MMEPVVRTGRGALPEKVESAGYPLGDETKVLRTRRRDDIRVLLGLTDLSGDAAGEVIPEVLVVDSGWVKVGRPGNGDVASVTLGNVCDERSEPRLS